jgi:hypothetical protein
VHCPLYRSKSESALPQLDRYYCLSWTDTKDNAQNLRMGNSLGELWVKAGPALFDGPKVKTRCVGNRLDVIFRSEIVIISWNCRMLPLV